MGSAVRGKPTFLKAGDVITASIEGIGTLTMPVVGRTESGSWFRIVPAGEQQLPEATAVRTRAAFLDDQPY